MNVDSPDGHYAQSSPNALYTQRLSVFPFCIHSTATLAANGTVSYLYTFAGSNLIYILRSFRVIANGGTKVSMIPYVQNYSLGYFYGAGQVVQDFVSPNDIILTSGDTVQITYTNLHTASAVLHAFGLFELMIKPSNMVVRPSAGFTYTLPPYTHPASIQFTDASTNNPTHWFWSFGDGQYSEERNPLHVYANAGTYDVYLIVSNAGGSNYADDSLTVK